MKTKCPCRFCGKNNIHVLNERTSVNIECHRGGHQVECVSCGARGPGGHVDSASAIAAWEGRDGYRVESIVVRNGMLL